MRMNPHHDMTGPRLRAFLLALRWRKPESGVQSGLHWMSNKAFDLGFAPGDFDWAIRAELVRRFPSGYCRLLPLGYRVLNDLFIRWPDDTSFPRHGVCEPPDMHCVLNLDDLRCSCDEKVKMH